MGAGCSGSGLESAAAGGCPGGGCWVEQLFQLCWRFWLQSRKGSSLSSSSERPTASRSAQLPAGAGQLLLCSRVDVPQVCHFPFRGEGGGSRMSKGEE